MGFPFVYQQFRFFFLKKEIICKQHFNRRWRLGFWVHQKKKKKNLFQVTVSTATFNFIPHVSIWLIRSFTTFIYNEMLCWWEIKKLISQGKKIYFFLYIFTASHAHRKTYIHTYTKMFAYMSTILFLLYVSPWNRRPLLIIQAWQW